MKLDAKKMMKGITKAVHNMRRPTVTKIGVGAIAVGACAAAIAAFTKDKDEDEAPDAECEEPASGDTEETEDEVNSPEE